MNHDKSDPTKRPTKESVNILKEQLIGKETFCCGWCGHPTDKDGLPLKPEEYQEGDNVKQLNGQCCPNGND